MSDRHAVAGVSSRIAAEAGLHRVADRLHRLAGAGTCTPSASVALESAAADVRGIAGRFGDHRPPVDGVLDDLETLGVRIAGIALPEDYLRALTEVTELMLGLGRAAAAGPEIVPVRAEPMPVRRTGRAPTATARRTAVR